jgi:hypothetical protein
MKRSFRRWALGCSAASVGMLVPAALAWACVGLMSLTTSASSVQPGGTVTVFGKEFAQGAPIEIHLDATTGPVLATVPPLTDTMTSQFNVRVTVPANTPTGPHTLVATEAYHYMNSGAPARATLYVGTPAPGPATPAARPGNVVVDKGPSTASLVLVALAVAAVALLVAGVLTLATSRRSARPEAARA